MHQTLLFAAATLLCACSATTTPPPGQSGDSTGATTDTPSPDPTATATATGTPSAGKMCGGIGGFPCPAGFQCEDDPSDQCDPKAGGRDCGGICVPAKGPAPGGACDRPERKYVAKSVDKCAAIRYFCEKDYVAFHDDCGCGCEPAPGKPSVQGEPCKDKVCAQGEFCCNASCGICAPKGGACTQQMCQ